MNGTKWRLVDRTPAFAARLPDAGLMAVRVDLPDGKTFAARDDLAAWTALHQRWTGTTKQALRSHPVASAYIELYRQAGINPKDHPPAAMNLVQRFLLGATLGRLPRINTIVDAVNLAAAETLVPLAALDAQKLSVPLCLDLSGAGEEFLGFGYTQPETLAAGTPVLRDNTGIVSVFCYRDGQKFAISSDTRSVLVLACSVSGIDSRLPEQALARVLALLQVG